MTNANPSPDRSRWLRIALATALVLSVEGPFWATMTAVAGERSGAGGGVMNMGSNIGGLISPALTPILAASIGWEGALLVSAALAVVAALLWFWIQPPPVIVHPAAWPDRSQSK